MNGSGANDRAVVTIPLVCNVNLTNDPLADEFEIEVQATWQEKAPFLDSDTTGQAEFGIGAKIGDRIWVANYGFETMAPVWHLAHFLFYSLNAENVVRFISAFKTTSLWKDDTTLAVSCSAK